MANFQQGGALLINADYNLSGAVNFVTAPTVGPLTATGQPNASSLVGTNDANGVNRIVINPTAKTIANASATALFNVTRTSNVAAAGVIFYQATATDGTDYQTIMGMVTYAHVDKAGTGTFTITEVSGNQAKAVSTGTYTLAWTYVTGTGIGVVKLQPTTSLTATVHTVTYSVLPISGAIAIQ